MSNGFLIFFLGKYFNLFFFCQNFDCRLFDLHVLKILLMRRLVECFISGGILFYKNFFEGTLNPN